MVIPPRPLVLVAAAALLLGLQTPAAATIDASASTAATASSAPPTVGALRVNGTENPLGIDGRKPRLGWQLDADRRGVTQSAYQVRVARSEARLSDPDVWDSGKVESRQSVEVPYGGPALASGTGYVWSVRVWDDTGAASSWSDPATFETGLLTASDWKAAWVGAARPELGAHWTDYTIEFTASRISGALGVYFRGRDTEHAYMWQISEAEKSLRPHVKDGGYRVLPATPFPAGFDFAAEHRYRVEVDGTTIRTSVDGALLDERTDATFTGAGALGFRTSAPETGLVHDVVVTSDDGTTLVDTTFPAGDRTFSAGTVADGTLRVDAAGPEVWLRRDDPVPLLRKEFDLAGKEVERARVYASARGVYRLHLNGERVGDHELAPGWTAYDKRIDHQTYDVTDLVRSGDNAFGAELSRGWYTGNIAMFGPNTYGTDTSLIAQLVVDFTDGTSTTVATDGSWNATDGPVRAADLLDGETFDRRRADALGDWDEPSYEPEGWTDVVVRDEPVDTLEPQTAPPVRVTQELTETRRIDSPTDGAHLYDLGQNMVGHVRLTLDGDKGDTVRIRHGEVLNPDGTLYTANLRSAKATDYYTLGSDGPETYEPAFTFHGFRYVEVTGVDEAPDAEDVVGVVVGTDGELTSELDTSSDLVDQLHRNIVWGMRGNFLSIPTDTPARDERMGWTGDINVFARTAVYDMDAQTFLDKWLQDLRDTQRANGSLPGVAPIVPGRFDGGYESAGWMDAGVHVPWTLWRAYGDTEVIRDNYTMMKKYVDFLDADSTNHIRSAGGYLDWLNLDDPTPADVLDTAFVAKSTREFAQMAEAIGNDADAAAYQARYEAIRAAYQDAFVAADGTVKGDSQTSYILTIINDLAPADRLDAVVDQFVETLERRDYHLSTGFLGVDGLLPALTKAGRTDIAYRLLQNEDYPSWGYEIGKGATTIWERWNSINPDGTFNDVGMNSFNHYAYGAVGEWMYRTMAGVSELEPGYRKVLVAPEPGEGIDHVTFAVETRYGPVRSAWKKVSGGLDLEVSVPANTTAEIRIPAPGRWAVTEGGGAAESADGVRFVAYEDGHAVYEVGSGDYRFGIDRALGELGEAAADVDVLAGQVDALATKGLLTRLLKRHLQAEVATLDRQVEQARAARAEGDRDTAATRTHQGLATVSALELWVDLQRVLRLVDTPTAASLKATLARIDGHLSAASGVIVGAVAKAEPRGPVHLAGDTVRVAVTLQNTGTKSLPNVTSALRSASGWTVEPVGARPATVAAGTTVTHLYDVVVPDGSPIGAETLTGTVSYRQSWGRATLPVSADVVVSPTLTLDSAAVAPQAATAGDEVTVTAVVRNHSTRPASGELTVSGPGVTSPAPTSYTVPAGATADVPVTVTVPTTVVGGPLTLTASTGATESQKAAATLGVTLTTPPPGAVDHVDVGLSASEQAHGLTASPNSGTNVEAGLTRRYTHSSYPGGWFEMDLDVPAGKAFVLRAVETYDGARRKTYDIVVDGVVVHSHDARRTEGGEGTQTYQVLVDRPDLTADGTVRVRFQDTGADYDPSIADVWSLPVS
ncbi:family 78 glycoside hydrolase catalytic domain [Mumia sp. zg.B53]|uniref:family 78 glycoside hydrolase catalytic domain n=1 Tax=Mumia sp. zg.B53 TaxID=2855449 RepID=UPI0027E23EA3|nr:family 78 glycoside hydrolase catalytic domain [Mumia sp. zg.B53]